MAWDLKYPSVEGFYSGEGGAANMFLGSMKQMQQMKMQRHQQEVQDQQLKLQQQQEERAQAAQNEAQRQHIDEYNRRIADDERRKEREDRENARKDAVDFTGARKRIGSMLDRTSPDYDPAGARAESEAWQIKNLHEEAPQTIEGLSPEARSAVETVKGGAPHPGREWNLDQDDRSNLLMAALGRAPANLHVTKFMEENNAFPERDKAYAEAKKNEEAQNFIASEGRPPTYVGESEKYGPVRFDVANREKNLERIHGEAADRIQAVAEKLGPLDLSKANEVALVAAKVRSRMLTPEKANQDLNAILGFRLGLERAKINAEGQAARADADRELKLAGLGERQAGTDLQQKESFLRHIQSYSKRVGLDRDVHEVRELSQAAQVLGSAHNSLIQRNTQFKLAKAMAGAGVMSNQDFTKSVENMSGVAGAAQSWYQRLVNGELGEQEVEILRQALKIHLSQARERVARDQAGFRTIAGQQMYSQFGDLAAAEYQATFGDPLGQSAGPGGFAATGPVLQPADRRRGVVKKKPPPKSESSPALSAATIEDLMRQTAEMLKPPKAKAQAK